MLYLLLALGAFQAVFGDDDDDDDYVACHEMSNACDCVEYDECFWSTYSKGDSCGWCQYVDHYGGDECEDIMGNHDWINIYCYCSDDKDEEYQGEYTAYTWQEDACWAPDEEYCESTLCEDYWEICIEDEEGDCYAIFDQVWTVQEDYYDSCNWTFFEEECWENEPDFVALVGEICWDDVAGCDDAQAYLECAVEECYSDDEDDCGSVCSVESVACSFDEYCTRDLNAIVDSIEDGDEDGGAFWPYELDAAKDAYCDDNSGDPEACNDLLNDVWECFSTNCHYAGCPYDDCREQMDACYGDSECQDELNAAVEYVDTNYGEGDGLPFQVYMLLIGYHCEEGDIDCTNENFNNLIECLENECDGWAEEETEGDCFLDDCWDLLEGCFDADNACAEKFLEMIAWSDECEPDEEDYIDADGFFTTPESCLNYKDQEGCELADSPLQCECWLGNCDDELIDLYTCIFDCDDDERDCDEEEEDDCDDCFQDCEEEAFQCLINYDCYVDFFYGLEDEEFPPLIAAMFGDMTEDNFLTPTELKDNVETYYCGVAQSNGNTPACNDYFWNILDCFFLECLQAEFYDENCEGIFGEDNCYGDGCMWENCFTLADDCLTDEDSQCHSDMSDARTDEAYESFEGDDSEETADNFEDATDDFCSDRGEDGCSEEFETLATCYRVACILGEEYIPGEDYGGDSAGAALTLLGAVLASLFALLQ